MSYQTAQLGDICEIKSGGTPLRSKREFYGGSIPWAKISDLDLANGTISSTEETITSEGLEAIHGRLFKPGTLLFAIYGSIGKMAFAAIPLSTNQAILGLDFRDARIVEPRFIYHWLSANNPRFLNDGQGIAQKNLSAAYLRNLEIMLPRLDEQRRISTILDKADALRGKRKRALELLDNLTTSLISKYLLDATDIVELGSLLVEGPTNGLYKPASFYGDGTPILRIDAFYDGKIINLSRLKRLRTTEIERSRFELKDGDIIVNRVNSLEYLGKSALVVGLKEPTVFESNMMKFVVDTDRLLPDVCIALLQTASIKRQILNKAKNAVNQSSINQSDVRSLRIPYPSKHRQLKFSKIAHLVAMERHKAVEACDRSSTLFAALQSRAFSGQL